MLLNEILNIKYPIIQGGMANIATAEFAATVSNAGGLGLIASGALKAEDIRIAIRKCKELTDKPFGVNIMLMNYDVENIVKVILEEHVPVVTTGAGNPGPYINLFKEKNIKVFPVVPSVSLALRLEKLGVDGLIVEGTEAGGHVGDLTTMALVPQVIEKVNIPVIAAGGIASGKGLNAALALGACGVQIGTCLLVAEECPIHDNYKNIILKAKDRDTVVTGRSLGAPVRGIKNKMTKSFIELEEKKASREEFELLALGGLKKAVFAGDVEYGSVMAGQIAGLCNTIRPVKVILENLILDAQKERDELINKINSLVNEV